MAARLKNRCHEDGLRYAGGRRFWRGNRPNLFFNSENRDWSSRVVELIVEHMDLWKQIKQCDLAIYLAMYIYIYPANIWKRDQPSISKHEVEDRLLFHVAATLASAYIVCTRNFVVNKYINGLVSLNGYTILIYIYINISIKRNGFYKDYTILIFPLSPWIGFSSMDCDRLLSSWSADPLLWFAESIGCFFLGS